MENRLPHRIARLRAWFWLSHPLFRLAAVLLAALIGLALFWLVGPARVARCQSGGCVGYYCDHWVQTPGGGVCKIDRCLDADCTETREEVSAPIRCSCACTAPYDPAKPPTDICQCQPGIGGCGANIIGFDPLPCAIAIVPQPPRPTPTRPASNDCGNLGSPVPPGTTCGYAVQDVRLNTRQEPPYPVVTGQDTTGRGFTLFASVDPGWTRRYVARKCSKPDEGWQIGGCCSNNCQGPFHRCKDSCKKYDENGNYIGCEDGDRCQEEYWNCPYCLAEDLRHDTTTLAAFKMDLCGGTRTWIEDQLSNRYPRAEVKGSYDGGSYYTLCSGAGCGAEIPIRVMPEDPGGYCFTFHVETTGTCGGRNPCPEPPHRPPLVIDGETDGGFWRKVKVFLRDTTLAPAE